MRLSTGMLWAAPGLLLTTLLTTAPASASSSSAAVISVINFDGGTAGTPCLFQNVNPLRDKYAGFGIHFRGPSASDGGAILDQCSNFGVSARSGLRFLAFNNSATMKNGGTPRGPETIRFDSKKRLVQIYVSQGSATGTATFKLTGKRAGNTIATATVVTSSSAYSLLKVTNSVGFDQVVLGAFDPNGQWVADDFGVQT